jgi:hypothetical protein
MRTLTLLLLTVVLASGMTGRGFGVVGAASEPAVGSRLLAGDNPAVARVYRPGEQWRALAQDVASGECDVRGIVEAPAEGATVPSGPMTFSGWAADISAASGSGIDEVRISLDADPTRAACRSRPRMG